tara:strand:+ start:87047 stop:87469 length:423 start_codon:yes stop_codon:yes gene_type:complete
MKLIAHRGNIDGKNAKDENSPDYLERAFKRGYDAEVDVWALDGIYFGHDEPQYESDVDFLLRNHQHLWIHCKNIEALSLLSNIVNLNVFWHENDAYTLTSKGYIWTYPHQKVCEKSVIVSSNAKYMKFQSCFGVCSDFLV